MPDPRRSSQSRVHALPIAVAVAVLALLVAACQGATTSPSALATR
jgi:hypothetical protein